MKEALASIVTWARSLTSVDTARSTSARSKKETAQRQAPAHEKLDSVSATFALSAFERSALAFLLACEVDSSLIEGRITIALLLDKLEDSHWDAFAAESPLRRWELIQVDSGSSLAQSSLKLEEGVLIALLGGGGLDEALLPYVQPVQGESIANPRLEELGVELGRMWLDQSPIVNLAGDDSEPQITVTQVAARQLGLRLWRMNASLIPGGAEAQFALARRWTRFAAIHGGALLIDAREDATGIAVFAKQLRTATSIFTADRLDCREVAHLEVPRPTLPEQTDLWQAALGEDAMLLNGQLRLMVEQFEVPVGRMEEVLASARRSPDGFEKGLWREAKTASRRRLDELAHRTDPVATWEDLVLPAAQKQTLKELVSQVRRRVTVHHDWGFGDRIARGLGVAALFYGPSGTGKTLSAEVVANELGLDLFRIDLSSVVSKYIGETEKNLKRVFDAAERCGAVLLFDEADALFGKRTEVKDSHDRYANIEVGYLLQRMESYRGIAILTTNMKEAFDPAFLRRLRFVVGFAFPGEAERKEIWRRCLPAKAPLKKVDFNKLAKLTVPGGHIRNIALSAAFLAADQECDITMAHFLAATRTEFSKFEKPLIDSEVAGWV